MDENQLNQLKDLRDLVSDEFEKHYNPSDMVLNYIDSLLKADEGNKMNKRCELISKLNSNILLLSVLKFMIEGDILQFLPYHDRILIV